MRHCLFFALTLGAIAPPSTAAALRLLRVESVSPRLTTLPAGSAETLALQLPAGGTVHELRLKPNTRLGAVADRVRGRATAYEGRVADRIGSWAALTRIGDRWAGMWYDGANYYGIEQAADLASASADAASAPGNRLMVYRLRDAVLEDFTFDGDTLQPGPATAADLAGTLSAELAGEPAMALATLPDKRLLVAVLADAALTRQDGSQTENNLLAQLNIVDGIFASQAGVRIGSGSVTVFSGSNDPFTGTTAAESLLREVRDYRSASALQRGYGLTHLMTGRNLDGRTVGIAYQGALCSGSFGASLSQATSSVGFAALITAHEIGHVFGAPHDAEAGSACEAEFPTYLMAPQLNGSQTFSSCSLTKIAPTVASAACLVPAEAPDVAVEAPATVPLALDRVTEVTILGRSVGNISANSTNLRVTLPSSITLEESTTSQGCVLNRNVLDCPLGTLAPGSVGSVTLRVRTAVAGITTASARVSASGDVVRANDTATIRFVAEVGTDLLATLVADPASPEAGGTVNATAVIENRGPSAVSDARLALTIPAGLTLMQQVPEGITCETGTGTLTCGPVALAVGATAKVQLVLQATTAGTALLLASASSSRAEQDPTNDRAETTVVVRAPPTPGATGGGSSGGGGVLPPALIAALLGMLAARLGGRGRTPDQARAK